MPFTEIDKTKIRMYMGWTPLFFPTSVALENAMNAVDELPEVLLLIQNAIGDSPPGIIASLEGIEAKIVAAHNRLKADEVGSIVLNRQELKQLYREGKRITSKLAVLLGTNVVTDIWSGYLPRLSTGLGGNLQRHG